MVDGRGRGGAPVTNMSGLAAIGRWEEGALEEEEMGFKMGKVGGRGVRHNAGFEWDLSAAVSAIATNGRGRDDDVSMTSSLFF